MHGALLSHEYPHFICGGIGTFVQNLAQGLHKKGVSARFAELEYGWAKLMAEMTLKAYHRQRKLKTASVRIFTAYGPRENERAQRAQEYVHKRARAKDIISLAAIS
jgi:nucleoside-diphosphate-sugar epimerase